MSPQGFRLLRHSVTLLIFGSAILSSTARACGCLPSFKTSCENYWTTDAVFAGRVASVDPRSSEELKRKLLTALPFDFAARFEKNLSPGDIREALRHLLPPDEFAAVNGLPDDQMETTFEKRFLTRRVRIQVMEPFRGIAVPEVIFTTDFSSCSVDFRENESYLIFAWRDRNTHELQTGACTGTTPIAEARDQLKYIRGLKTGETLSRVFGFVTADPMDIQFPMRASKPVSGVPIVIRSGSRAWSAVTDLKGMYEIVGLPAGTYEVRAISPNVQPEQAARKMELQAGACSRQNFLAVQTGSRDPIR